MVSAFGSTDAPTSNGADPIETANTMAAFVQQFGFDGIDVDYEDFNAINSGTGDAENWLISFTNQLRSQLPAGRKYSLSSAIEGLSNLILFQPIRIHHHSCSYRTLVH